MSGKKGVHAYGEAKGQECSKREDRAPRGQLAVSACVRVRVHACVRTCVRECVHMGLTGPGSYNT